MTCDCDARDADVRPLYDPCDCQSEKVSVRKGSVIIQRQMCKVCIRFDRDDRAFSHMFQSCNKYEAMASNSKRYMLPNFTRRFWHAKPLRETIEQTALEYEKIDDFRDKAPLRAISPRQQIPPGLGDGER